MIHSVKKIVTLICPNIINYYQLYKKIKKDKSDLKEIKSLSEEDYPSYLERYYEQKLGNKLNLDNPIRFTEKIQWRKLYDRNPVYTELSDKYKVRSWVKHKIGENYLIPLLGCWDNFEDIDFERLPDKFVLKLNNGCHANFIVTNKKAFLREKESIKKKIQYSLDNSQFLY